MAEEWFAKLFLIHLEEEIEAVDLGLPEDCDPDTITWVGGAGRELP